MPSAANGKSEKSASSEATDNTPIRQILTIIEHKIRNLEKRKSKLTSYRDIQKTGKELNADQKIAVAKYDEVAQTLEFARDLSKQVTAIVVAADRDAKKQAKKDAWVRNAIETSKIRDILLILDCLTQMGSPEARQDFLNGTNGAAKLTEDDIRILDDLYPEVTPKHELNEENAPGFHIYVNKAAEHLYAIIDGKPKEVLGTTYAHIKEIIGTVHECGYFDKQFANVEQENVDIPVASMTTEDLQNPVEEMVEQDGIITATVYAAPPTMPVPPPPAVVSAPAYSLRSIPPITLQEVEHAFFSQHYPQQRPISEVIGSQNFIFLQESEIDSPVGTPQPPAILNQLSPPAPIPTQTFTNQHFVQMPASRVPPEPNALPIPQPHFASPPDHPAFVGVPLPTHPAVMPPPLEIHVVQQPSPGADVQSTPPPIVKTPLSEQPIAHSDEPPKTEMHDDEWKENQSPECDETTDRSRTQGQGDGPNRFRRFGRGGRGPSNGYRGRGGFQNRQNNDGYQNRHNDNQNRYNDNQNRHNDNQNRHNENQNRYNDNQNRQNKENYQSRQYNNDGYQNRHNKDGYQNRNNDGYYGNGDTGNGHQHSENNGTRDRNENYQGGFKSRGRGSRGTGRGAPRPPRPQHFNRKTENVE